MKTHLCFVLTYILAFTIRAGAASPPEMKDYYIAKAAPDADATGTRERPFGVNTAGELTAVLNGIPTYSHIHFCPGEFAFDPIVMKEGWKLSGAGMDATFLTETAGSGALVFSDYPAEVRDLTLNGNASASGGTVNCGIGIYAARGIVERVKVINTGGPAGEAFPILLAGKGSDPCQFIVRDCIVTRTLLTSNGSVAIVLTRWAGPGVPAATGTDGDFGLVEGNTLIGGGGLGIAAFNNATFRSNYVDNTGMPWNGFNSDTGANNNLVIEANTFIGSSFPYTDYGLINLSAGQPPSVPSTHARISHNYIKTDMNGHWTAGIRLGGNVQDAEISGNVIVQRNADEQHLYGISTARGGNLRLRLLNNRCESPCGITSAATEIALATGNRTLTGDVIATLPDRLAETESAAQRTALGFPAKNQSFEAVTTGNQAPVAADTWTKVLFDETSDPDSVYASSRATPKIAGKVLFTGMIALAATETRVSVAIYKNGVLWHRIAEGSGFGQSFSAWTTANGTTDYFEIWIKTPTAATIGPDTFCQGIVVGP